MKLYTKLGDQGQTVLADGTRVWKDDLRVDAYGTVDELNATLGWCRTQMQSQSQTQSSVQNGLTKLFERSATIQTELLVMGAQLATGAKAGQLKIELDQVYRLEQWIDQATEVIGPLSHFILPGGCELAARLHVARTVCRRAERAAVSLGQKEAIAPELVIYLNRLSDLFFAWARLANHEAHMPETQWNV